MATTLIEIDALEIEVLVDNEVDPMSGYTNPGLEVTAGFLKAALESPHPAPGRAEAQKELQMTDLCCGAHGLSLMIVSSYKVSFSLYATGVGEELGLALE